MEGSKRVLEVVFAPAIPLLMQSVAAEVTWTTDLGEVAGIPSSKRIRISRWTPDTGLAELPETAGGTVSLTMEAQPLDIIALKLEVIP